MDYFAQLVGRLGCSSLAGGAMLAPMSGISDIGMRRAAERFGAGLVVSEMVDSDFYVGGDAGSRIKAQGSGIACHVVQIAGCDPRRMARSARIAQDEGAAMIDINMGCPAKKVVGGLAGSALMRDLDHATTLIRAVVGAVNVPVSLKMRLGWDNRTVNAPVLAARAEAEGVAMVTVHGRTRCQFYNGSADWAAIRAVKRSVTIPVVANGDCASLADARAMLAASGADAIMIGRAAVGRPWLVGAVAKALRTDGDMEIPSRQRRGAVAREHYDTLLSIYGRAQGVRHARKHLAAYANDAGWPSTTSHHRALVTSEDPDAVLRLLDLAFVGEAIGLAA